MSPPAAVAAAGALALVSARLRLLTTGGGVAAFVVGLLVLLSTGWVGGAVLLAFFVPASLVSHLGRPPAAGLDPKGEQRGAVQVLANGLAPAAGSTLAALSGAPQLAWVMLVTGLAVAAADTWGTALGSWSRRPPRRLHDWRRVPRGASGGVSAMGSAGALAGATLVGLAGTLGPPGQPVLAAVIIGMAGMFLDAILGGAAQGRFHCSRCDLPSEWARHRCGADTLHVGGIRWLNNDAVNAIATAVGTAAGIGWWVLSARWP